ncbi:hypothetical protein WICPIJ_003984 [Wickerhamomyces pijperi]|uniref:Secreted protein n=1 Tax=Wickerhamomyces pijperi TaxID=599730 RepID=A0A9P8Q8L7_WICPI|nr:hypothetical protein WICPIJ_003984 [Wickerhamomyces pijperi]
MSFNFKLISSLTLIPMIFQSNSPSSIKANAPRIFTSLTSPTLATAEPISTMSKGSLSPNNPVSGSLVVGSSHV